MRYSKVLSVAVVTGLVLAAASTSMADPSPNPSPPNLVCKKTPDGKFSVTAKGTNGWRINGGAPWKWDQAPTATATFANCDKDNHCDSATFVGTACSGNVKAFVCTPNTCAPPVSVPVPAASP